MIVPPSPVMAEDADVAPIAASGARRLAEDETEFWQYLDETYGDIQIGDVSFTASQVLQQLDETAYGEQLVGWREEREQQRRTEIVDLVLNRFPTPVAYHFDRLQHGCSDDQQRVRVIRDVWESLIFVLYALLLGEVRARAFSLETTDIKRNQLLSNKINDRLAVMKKIVELPTAAGQLACSDLITPQLVEELAELNRARNEFSHEEFESPRQAADILALNRPALLAALQRVSDLAGITLMRYESQQCVDRRSGNHEVRGVVFRGSSTNRRFDTCSLTQGQIAESLSDLSDAHIIVHVYGPRGRIWSVAPFIHFKEHDEGHTLRLCYYKDKRAANPNDQNSPRQFDYSVSGLAQKFTIAESVFQTEMDELRALLPDLSGRGATA